MCSRESNQDNVSDDIACAHGEKLGKALPTPWARIWYDLPVVVLDEVSSRLQP